MDKPAWKSKPGHRFDRLGEVVSQYDARRIAVVEYPPYFKPGTNDLSPDAYREAEEIGAMLAAAPDLLACCIRAKEILDQWGPERWGDTLQRLHERLDKAIKKATVTL